MRKEIRYEINYKEYKYIQAVLKSIMARDRNSKPNGEYEIKTVYFDNYRHEIQNNKKEDINSVNKYRIRMYNNQEDSIFLERKTNENGYILKEKIPITKKDVINILDGNYKEIFDKDKILKMDLYLNIILRHMRPELIMSYKRIAYADDVSKARITIDRDVRSTTNLKKFFEKIPAQYNKKYILEIKYEKYLPDYIKDIVVGIKNKKTTKSKYRTEIEKYNFEG